jgi:hypothetical protein
VTVSTAPPDPIAPSTRSQYPIPARILRALAFTLPRPGDDEPETAWDDEIQAALDALSAFDPRNPIEAMLAFQIIAANAGAADALRLAFEPITPADQALRHRANSTALTRTATTALRLLKQQQKTPVGPPRDWGDAVADLATAWRQAPARPAQAAHSGKKSADNPATVVRWIDELTDAEVQVAVEQERREKAGEPPLPRKPGEPHVLYRYKADDYIHKFKPDPKNFRHYPGYENMTMAERREFFGYTYTGPNGPPEAPTPASRDLMLKQMAEEELLKAEYGM